MIIAPGDEVYWQQSLPHLQDVYPMAAQICKDLKLSLPPPEFPLAFYWQGYGPIRKGIIEAIYDHSPTLGEAHPVSHTLAQIKEKAEPGIDYQSKKQFWFIISEIAIPAQPPLDIIKDPSVHPFHEHGFFNNQEECLRWFQQAIDSHLLWRERHGMITGDEYIAMGYLRGDPLITVGKCIWMHKEEYRPDDKDEKVFPPEKDKVTPEKISPPGQEKVTPPSIASVVPPQQEKIIPPSPPVPDEEKEQIDHTPIPKQKRKKKKQQVLEVTA